MGDSRPARLIAAVGRPGPVGGLHRGGFRSRQHSRATRSGPPPRDTGAELLAAGSNGRRWSAMTVTSARQSPRSRSSRMCRSPSKSSYAEPLPRYSDRGSGHGAPARNRRVVWRRLVQTDAQKIAPRQGVRCAPMPRSENVAMTARAALAFIRKHGVVLESARGPVPSLAQVIAGEPVRGSWWSHPKSREIFAVTRAVRDSDDVLVCRLIDGKITFVHRRLWPALVRVADRLPSVRLSQLREVHTRSGRHVTTEVPFPDWVPSNVRAVARSLSEPAALAAFAWIE